MSPARSGAEAPPGLGGEEQRGDDVGDHGQEPEREQVVGARHAERCGVQVRDERRLAVDGVDVEPPAAVEDLRLGGGVRLVGVERPVRQRRGVHRERRRRRATSRSGAPRVQVLPAPGGRRGVLDGRGGRRRGGVGRRAHDRRSVSAVSRFAASVRRASSRIFVGLQAFARQVNRRGDG